MHRFMIFVDGANLAGSLKRMNVRIKFDAYEDFFHHIFESAADLWKSTTTLKSVPDAQLVRVYWYELGSLDEWDLSDPKCQASLHDAFEQDRDLKSSYMALAGQKFPGEGQAKVATEAWAMCFNAFKEWYTTRYNTIESMRRFHHSLRGETDFIDIIECGHWKVDLLYRNVTEKGVDTRLAVDMLAMLPQYDIALVVSGDADTIPSINYAKDHGKHVGVVEFLKGYPPEKRGRQFSSRLKVAADFVVQVYEMDLVRKNMTESQQTQTQQRI